MESSKVVICPSCGNYLDLSQIGSSCPYCRQQVKPDVPGTPTGKSEKVKAKSAGTTQKRNKRPA